MSNTRGCLVPHFFPLGAFSRGGVDAGRDRAGDYYRSDVADVGVRSCARLHHGASRTDFEPIKVSVCVRDHRRPLWSALAVRLAPLGAPCATPHNADVVMRETYTL